MLNLSFVSHALWITKFALKDAALSLPLLGKGDRDSGG